MAIILSKRKETGTKCADMAACATFQNCDSLQDITAEVAITDVRSSYENFCVSVTKHRNHQRVRSREPSRIPQKKLARIFGKSRNVRQLARKTIMKNFSQTSNIHHYTKAYAFQRGAMCSYRYYRTKQNTNDSAKYEQFHSD